MPYEIVIVGDDPLMRHVIAVEIEEAGHFVTRLGSRSVAAKVAAADLIIVDAALADLADNEVVQHLRAAWPHAHVVAFKGDSETLPTSAPWDTCTVVSKDLRMAELIKGIEAAARGEPLRPAHDATASRLDLLLQKITTRPTVAGIQRQLLSVYSGTSSEALPKPFSALLDRLRPPPG